VATARSNPSGIFTYKGTMRTPAIFAPFRLYVLAEQFRAEP
jgi:hypothetical protein